MLNNPIQQIERTQDAYAGNPEGLQQRANMSKELIDLLAMQALQSDLAAQKRNMAMQQQGNPQTVKDQLEEGLMGEYRQKAAKDLGVGPSEGDVVERAGIAGQQMAQNAQMPQGPQGGGGVASQAGPVNLAGGGIVSFDAGGEVTDEYLQEKGMTRAEFDSLPPQQQEQIRRLQRHSVEGLSGFLEGLLSLPSGQQGTTRSPRGRRPAPSTTPSAAPSADPSAGGIASVPTSKYPPKEDSFQRPGGIGPTNQQIQQQDKDRKEAIIAQAIKDKEAMGQSQNPYADQLSAALGQDALQLPEYEPSAELNTAIQKLYTERDPDAAAAKARELFRDTENREINTEQLTRLDAMRERNVEGRSSLDTFGELLGGIAAQGVGGAGIAGRGITARRKQEEEAYETKRAAIQTARKNINETMGKEALASYDKAEEQNQSNGRALVTALDGLDARTRAAKIKNVELQSSQRDRNITALVGLTQRQESILNRRAGEGLRTIQEQAAASEALVNITTAENTLTQNVTARYMSRLDQGIQAKINLGQQDFTEEEMEQIVALREQALLDETYLADLRNLQIAKEKFQGHLEASDSGGISSTTPAGSDVNKYKDG